MVHDDCGQGGGRKQQSFNHFTTGLECQASFTINSNRAQDKQHTQEISGTKLAMLLYDAAYTYLEEMCPKQILTPSRGALNQLQRSLPPAASSCSPTSGAVNGSASFGRVRGSDQPPRPAATFSLLTDLLCAIPKEMPFSQS